MTQTQHPNHTLATDLVTNGQPTPLQPATTIATPDNTGWTINVYPTGPTYKIIAKRGHHGIHAEKQTADMVTAFDANKAWADGLAISAKLAAIRKAKS